MLHVVLPLSFRKSFMPASSGARKRPFPPVQPSLDSRGSPYIIAKLLAHLMTAIQNTAFYQKNGIQSEINRNRFLYFARLAVTRTAGRAGAYLRHPSPPFYEINLACFTVIIYATVFLNAKRDIVVSYKPVVLSKIEAREQLCESDSKYNDKAVRYFLCICWELCSDKACTFCIIVLWDVTSRDMVITTRLHGVSSRRMKP